jgi:hypothetical protein
MKSSFTSLIEYTSKTVVFGDTKNQLKSVLNLCILQKHALSSNTIIGPFFFQEKSVAGENYLRMLEEYLYLILMKKRIHRKIIFQQDLTMNQKFVGKWRKRCNRVGTKIARLNSSRLLSIGISKTESVLYADSKHRSAQTTHHREYSINRA